MSDVQRFAGHKQLDLAPMRVETDPAPDLLAAMLARTEAIFTAHSAEKPHWTVLTAPHYEPDQFEAHRAQFFQGGQGVVRTFQAFARRAGVDMKQFKTCFELGCGVGRLTVALAELFPRVIGADIAQPMLDEARATATSFKVGNIDWLLTNKFSVFEKLEPFDVFFTSIVLQHNPPPVQAWMLRTLLGKLNAGGIGYFQLPTHRLGYTFDAKQYLSAKGASIEMHPFPQRRLFQLISECGCDVLEVREDGSAGPNPSQISQTFLVQKR